MIDLYCERCGPGLLAEPFNATTNLAYLVAAWAAWILARRLNAVSFGIWGLILFSVMVGVGSGLFHTFATGWARVLDVVPILLFELLFVWLYARQVMEIRTELAAISAAAFLGLTLFGRQFPQVLNSSLPYIPAFLVLLGFGLYHLRRQRHGQWLLIVAAGVFTLAIFFRSIDQAICPYFPVGTHFLWHLLTGCVFYLSMRALIVNRIAFDSS